MKYNLKRIMLKAWSIYRKSPELGFAESLHRAWLSAKAEAINAERIATAKAEAGVASAIDGKSIVKEIYVKGRLVNIVVK